MFSKMIDNALTVTGAILTGELPKQQQVAQLLSDGLSVALIATMLDVGVEAVEALIENGETK